jgi:hypothetical protein
MKKIFFVALIALFASSCTVFKPRTCPTNSGNYEPAPNKKRFSA